MRPDYGERYRELYERHWWWRAREAAILEVLRAQQPPQGWKRILDVGCGDGLFFDRLAQFGEVEGIEPAEELVSNASAHRSHIHIAPFDGNFRPGRQFSLILMLDVLEHLPDPAGALRHALALLEPQGMLVVTVPAFRLLWTNHDVLNHHFTRYTARSFRNLARQAGLEIETEKYFFQWLFPVKLVTRLAERLLRLQPKPPNIPGRWINGLLYGLSRFEYKVLNPLHVPFGSSLLVVGKNPNFFSLDKPNEIG
jgi:2-polyprenyl-3-methyl-5-hydroxy-6-metoxy-1,4-benzoquinol methylase